MKNKYSLEEKEIFNYRFFFIKLYCIVLIFKRKKKKER